MPARALTNLSRPDLIRVRQAGQVFEIKSFPDRLVKPGDDVDRFPWRWRTSFQSL